MKKNKVLMNKSTNKSMKRTLFTTMIIKRQMNKLMKKMRGP